MKETLSFDETLMSSLDTKITVSKWDDTKEAYDQKRYKDVVLNLFDYLDLDIRKKYGNADETYFKIPHGSIIVEISITDTHFNVKAPFLKVGENQKIPLYRKIAEVNFSPLNLSQIKLDSDQLNFLYSTPLHLCEPLKIYYVLKEICHNADNFDDEFISLFDVEQLHDPHIENYSQEVLDTIWEKINSYLKEADQYIEYFDQTRVGYYNWDIINITLKRIDYLMAPHGKLRTDIENQVNDLYSQDDMQNRIQRGKKFLDTLKNKNKEELLADFYISESFVPTKMRSELEHIKQSWERPYENAKKEIQNKQYTAATLTLLVAFYDFYYYNNIPEDINLKMVNSLKNAAGKEWEASATSLFNGMDSILNGKAVQTSTPKKGFFSKLFG
ncbi:hypothetical protein [Aquimarina sp. AU58]|uniref:hypothetical protein n=1 Tax=Aquimarina sp. AU58 TaxID=1874112 RepID=UPI001357DF1F|nr:hypothetical protein [Aquimarina sp. AU58]